MLRRAIALLAFFAGSALAQGTGVVVGKITVDSTRGAANARVSTKGVAEVRTDSAGRFTLRNVPVGTHEIEVRAIGLDPAAFDVEVKANDTARVEINLDTKVPVLDSVKIRGENKVRTQLVNDFIQRRKQGLGHYADSTEIASHPLVMNTFDGMPGIRVIRGKGRMTSGTGSVRDFEIHMRGGIHGDCVANVWVDGVRQREVGVGSDFTFLAELDPKAIAAIEVYSSELTAPPEYVAKGCGSVIVWTKKAWP